MQINLLCEYITTNFIRIVGLLYLYTLHYPTLFTAAKDEHRERSGWWINELESLGLSVKKTNELNDLTEIRGLVENLKQVYYQDYKTIAYNYD